MSENQNPRDYGQQFKTELDRALSSGDFTNLNQLVQDTVRASVSGAAQQVKEAVNAEKTMSADKPLNYTELYKQRMMERKQQERQQREKQQAQQSANNANQPALYKKTGDVAGTLFQVFGGIGIGLSGITLFVFLLLYAVFHWSGFLSLAILFLLLTAGSAFMVGNGSKLKARLARAQRYFELSRKTGYINISQLAEAVGQKEGLVVKDIKALIANRAFPQGHLDKEQKCFMLNDKAYEEYQSITRQRERMEAEQAEAEEQKRIAAAADEELTEQQRALNAMIEEGHEYIRQIRQANDAIPGEVISQKLFRMEALLKEIFANLQKMPEQMSKMHRLMNYYLPTTLKLVTAYEQFEHMSVQGEDVVSAKREIENTIDTINDAFGELLNKLFSAAAMDAETDAQVLKTMLAKEGLTQGGMEYVYEPR
ncbi:MAG: 5-bromo-4-chloroindolyl phosphate hydrolysis family protein [Lachnospiraceae bacterium]|nr:5-bromo-4-chloroindolyl phosphate hydrolysis family protein [Lachnospiraceae bacterium]